jgi:hypothetical protein
MKITKRRRKRVFEARHELALSSGDMCGLIYKATNKASTFPSVVMLQPEASTEAHSESEAAVAESGALMQPR